MTDDRAWRRYVWPGLAAALLIAIGLVFWLRQVDPGGAEAGSAPEVGEDTDRAAHERRLRAIAGARAALPPELPRLALHGRVVDRSGGGVAGAAVALAEPSRVVASAADGSFRFDELVAGRHVLEARSGSAVAGPVQVELDPTTGEVLLRLRQGARAEVKVISASDGSPVPDATVQLALLSMYDGAGRQVGVTGADGIAEFPGVSLVAHSIIVAAPGYGPFDDTIDPMEVEGEVLTFTAELEPGATARGRVVDAAGQPVAGAVIEAMADERGGNPRTADDRARYGAAPAYAQGLRRQGVATDIDGRFEIGLNDGVWLLAASHADHETSSLALVVDGPGGNEDLEIVLGRGGRAAGVVVTSDDQPVPGARVQVRWQFGGRSEKQVTADGTGRFEITGLPPAPLELIAVGKTGRSSPLRIDLSQPVATEDLILQLDNEGVITGEVLEGKAPVADAMVVAVEITGASQPKIHPFAISSDAAGRFRITGLAPDRPYVVNVVPAADGDSWLRTTGARASAGDHVVIELPEDGSIRGRVELAGGGSPAAVLVAIEGNTPPRPVGRDGAFRFERVPARAHRLLFHGPMIPETRVTLEVGPGQDHDAGTILLPRGREVAGTVTYFDGGGVPGVDVDVRLPDGTTLRSHSEEDGSFSVIAPADLELNLVARHRRGGAAELVVAPGQPSVGLVLSFTGTGSVEGSVEAGGEPVSGLVVSLRPSGEEEVGQPLAQVQTDHAGYFRLEMIEAGAYDVAAWVTDPETRRVGRYRKTVQVEQGARAYVEFDVSDGADGAEPLPPPDPGGSGAGGPGGAGGRP